jgi:hypothetical protein
VRTKPLLLCLVLAACVDDCSCGKGDDEAETSSTNASSTKSSATRDAAAQSARDWRKRDAGAPIDLSRANEWLKEATASQADLAKAQKALRKKTKPTKATTEGKLAAGLGARAGDYEAQSEALAGTIGASGAELPQAVREYTNETGRLYVKVTDTGPSPALRDPIANALTEQRSVGGRYSRGALVQGFPALVTFAPKQRSGKAAVIVEGRYLVEARLAPSKQPEDIIRALEALDLSRIAK